MSLKFFNCPECDKATFIKADESNGSAVSCEYCGRNFETGDARPFEMSHKFKPGDSIYAC